MASTLLRPPAAAGGDEQPSSAPIPFHSRQRSRSLTRDLLPTLSPASIPSSPTLPPSSSSSSNSASASAASSPTADGSSSSSSSAPSSSSSSSSVTVKALMRQIEYYFSNANLWKDVYLLQLMTDDASGQQFVPLSAIAELKKVQRIASDLPSIIAAVRLSNKLALNADCTMLRRLQPLPPYDQLKDAHRSLYVDHLPPASTLKSVKKLFSVFGKVTYVLRADQIQAAATLNASPRLSPASAPTSPGRDGAAAGGAAGATATAGAMPRLSLGGSAGSLSVPSSAAAGGVSASDSVDSAFSSAFVQFESAASMEQAVSLIQSQQKAAKAAAAAAKSNGMLNAARRSVTDGRGSPAVSTRALAAAAAGVSIGVERAGGVVNLMELGPGSPIPHINDLIIGSSPQLIPKTSKAASLSSPPLSSSLSADSGMPSLDLPPASSGSAPPRPTTPNTPSSPLQAPLDPNTPLPAVFLTLTVQSKGEYLHDQEERQEKEREREEKRKEAEKKRELEKKKAGSSWRSVDSGGSAAAAAHAETEVKALDSKADDSKEDAEDPIIRKLKEEARLKERQDEAEREKSRAQDKEYRRQHLSERLQERQVQRQQQQAAERQQELDGIIHISPRPSPRPSPVMRPALSPILIAQPAVLSISTLGQHSPLPFNLSLSPSLPPAPSATADLQKPRFSLTKRTSVVAASVASHFALGPDAPDSRGFNGRGRGKILPLMPLPPQQQHIAAAGIPALPSR